MSAGNKYTDDCIAREIKLVEDISHRVESPPASTAKKFRYIYS